MSLASGPATTRATACAACGHGNLEVVHRVDEVPTNSCILVDSRESAVAYPRGTIELAFCHTCGFIGNVAFESERVRYGAGYEETQAFSPRFREFAAELAATLVERHQLVGREVLEIGCGKAEFLAMLCSLGVARGVGIDPGYAPDRLEEPGAERVSVITDFYGPKYEHLSGDLVLCRHTLEHIAPVREFVERVRRSAERRPGSTVVFEVPDTGRVLREGAFWDIYYEHVSYFTPVSLKRLFSDAGYELERVEMAFDDQYLILTGRPSRDHRHKPPSPDEQAVSDLHRDVQGFKAAFAATVEHWRRELDRLRGRRLVLWGSGSKAVAWLTSLGVRDEIEFVVDINPHKHGKYLAGSGHAIVAPEFLADYRPEAVIAMNPIYRSEIARDLDRMGLRAELLAV